MKKLLYILLLCLPFATVNAQNVKSDSLAYQLQRQKINTMLDVRRQKFGEYDESLTKHSGIFGFQTKKDIRRSNDILMQIVQSDDDIFREIKVLLDYRTFEQAQVQTHSDDAEKNSIAYMNTINRLRNQVDDLKKQAADQQEHYNSMQRNFLISTGVMVALFAALLMMVRKRKKD